MNLTRAIFFISTIFCISSVWGFDPTLIASGAETISGILGGLDKADEVADIGFALGDLLSELGVDNGTEAQMDKTIKRLEDLNQKAKELKWSHAEIKEALESNLSESRSLKERINSLRSMIAASKKIAAILAVRPKAGEKANQVQLIRVNSMILEELQDMRRAQFLALMEQREIKARRDIFLQEIIEKERGGRLSQ
ncbi:hypothetical protein [Bdellovibrio sp. HCB-162]|uniref:hypothetical protein n=1 Tax=Bdellovibrio sp. HCB-162 TaxID=3394234 RepID=UPI0039BC9137